MGLLDDAIREHLELKRAHGADPAEVAAQEREVLGAGQQPAADAATITEEPYEAAAEAPPAIEDAPPLAEPVEDSPVRGDTIGQPTVEYDVLGADEAAPASERFAPEPDLDWSDPAPAPSGEPDADAASDEPEDVLEETPEFLEETPEHDRLWFEQRPPRDFDF
jgi:hypothetical protein